MLGNETNPTYKVQVLERALGLLNVLGASPEDMSLNDLSEAIGLHKSTVHRLVSVLEQFGYVERHPENGKYRLGLKLFELGSKAIGKLDMRERARPHLQRLAFEAGETVHLCVLDDGEVLYVDKVEPARSVRTASSVGRRNPVHCTGVGKAMLAELPEADVDAILRRHGQRTLTRNTITTPVQLKLELANIRKQGFSLDREENEEGVACVAAPIRDHSGAVIAAISISGPTFRVNEGTFPALSHAVRHAAEALSADLGWQAIASKAAAR